MINIQQSASFIPYLVSFLVFCIMIFSIFVTIRYRTPEQYKQTRLNVFFSTLASVAIIFVGMNIFLTSISFEYNQHFSRITKTKEAIDKLWHYPNRLILDFHNMRPEFRASFVMANPVLYPLTHQKSKPTEQGTLEELFLMNVMLQAWEDCLTFRRYDVTPLDEWAASFISWAQNPYFREYYNTVKFGFKDNANQFATLLFEYAATIPVPSTNPKYYENALDKLIKDPRYIKLKKQVEGAKSL